MTEQGTPSDPIEPAPKPHISASQVNMFTNCGEQYRRRYVERHVLPPGVAALRGSSVHKGAEMNFAQKIESRADLPKAQIVERAAAEFEDRARADGVLLSDEEEARGKAVVLGEEKDTTVRLAGLLAETVAPLYQPTAVESRQLIALPSSPRDVLGILDLMAEQVAAPGVVGIVDYKTGKKVKSQAEFDSSPALSIYSLTYKAKMGQFPAFINVEQLVDTKEPKRVLTTTTRALGDYKALIARLNSVIVGIERQVFIPANTGWWGCSPKWCGYWRTCPYVNAERKAAAEKLEAAG